MTLTDVEIFNLCEVRLIYLGPAKYGILRDIKHPLPGSIAQRASPSSERKPANTKKKEAGKQHVKRANGLLNADLTAVHYQLKNLVP